MDPFGSCAGSLSGLSTGRLSLWQSAYHCEKSSKRGQNVVYMDKMALIYCQNVRKPHCLKLEYVVKDVYLQIRFVGRSARAEGLCQ